MKTTTLTFPELILVAATRAMLGAGVALLISRRLNDEQRETAGIVLTAIGILTTFPLIVEIFGKSEDSVKEPPSRRAEEDLALQR